MTEAERKAGTSILNGATELCNRTWWVFLIGGVASVAFGVLAFVNPAAALFVLAIFFSAYVLVDGAVNIWGALNHREMDGWWIILLLGAASVLVGGYALLVPPVSMAVFIYVVAFIAMFVGLLTLFLGWKVRAQTPNEWILYLTGALSVLFALLILFKPDVGGLSVVYLIASWAIVIGILRILFAFAIRKAGKRLHSTST